MAGSVEERGKGKWRLNVNLGLGKDGKYIRKRKTVAAKNKTEARKMLAEFVTEVEKGEYVAPSHIKFKDYVERWRTRTVKDISPGTMESYNYSLDKRIIPEFGHIKMEDINPIHLDDYLNSLDKELSSSSIKKQYNILNSIFKLAKKNEVIKKNPMENVDPPQVKYKEGQVYNSEELKTLYELLNEEENKQMALMVKTSLKTGLRKGELLALQWDDIDFATNTIHVRHSLSYTKDNGYQLKEPKTKGSVRKVAPPKKLMEELKKHIHDKRQEKMAASELWFEDFGNFVFSTNGYDENGKMKQFGKPYNIDSPNRWWARFLTRVNKQLKEEKRPQLKKITWHDLRHCAATDLINKGANIYSISKRLGHSSIKTTMNIYGHYLEEADQKIADMLDEDYI